MKRDSFVSECKNRYQRGETIENILSFLREAGCSKIDSIAVLTASCGIGLGKAKELVQLSATWKDTRHSDDKFHDLLINEISAKNSEE